MKTLKEFLKEDVPTNNVGGGAIDGIGIGEKGEPGIKKKKKKKIDNMILNMIRRK